MKKINIISDNNIKSKKIKIAVIGLGYVGLNLLINFAKEELIIAL